MAFLAVACSNSPEEQLKNLTGYWEIENVETPYGITKEYSISQNIDYIEIKGTAGFRKKVQANLMGAFITSEAVERFTVRIEDDTVFLDYETPFDSWSEEVLRATENKLEIKNKDNFTYTYNTYEPITLD